MTVLDIRSREIRVGIAPDLGGGVPHFEWLGGGTPQPLFRPWDGVPAARSTGSMPLIPWSNRISGGGIEAGGKFWPLPANRAPDDPMPIHGDGFQSAWNVLEHGSSRIVLELVSSKQPPFDYRALLTYEVDGPSFTMRLGVEHRGVAGSSKIIAGSRDDDGQGLLARAHAGLHRINHRVGIVLVVLVHD